jgi:hypothetical protein
MLHETHSGERIGNVMQTNMIFESGSYSSSVLLSLSRFVLPNRPNKAKAEMAYMAEEPRRFDDADFIG